MIHREPHRQCYDRHRNAFPNLKTRALFVLALLIGERFPRPKNSQYD